MKILSALSLVLAAVWCAVATAAPATRYLVTAVTITDLGTLGGASSTALDINDAGEVVGWAHTPQGRRHAFLFRHRLMEDIGTAFGSYDSEASGINTWTRIVGTYSDPGPAWYRHGFHWDRGVALTLRDTSPIDCGGFQGSEAFAISDSDYIAGRIFCKGVGEAARWASPDAYTLVDHDRASLTWRAPPFVWSNVAYDVNWSGTVVGRTKDIERLVRWRLGPAPTRSIVPLPTGTEDAGWPDDGARAINDAGAVVGKVQRSFGSTWRAFFWAGSGASVTLGVLPGGLNSYADDLNEQGFVAGSADVPLLSGGPLALWRRVAFLYQADFGMRALPTLPGSVLGTCEAHAINERHAQSGQVQLAGYCETSGGVRRAVRWDVTVTRVPTTPPGPTP